MNILSMPVRAADVAALSNGLLTGNPDLLLLRARADSRLCRSGDLYVALPGERTDGNRFIDDAWAAGAETVLADSAKNQPPVPAGKALVTVSNPLDALHQIARTIRQSVPHLAVVGITGSNGKTTTKDILAAMLQSDSANDVLVSKGNYNSDVGLPLTLFELRSHHQNAVLEMGMNKKGEMAVLASIARPNIVVITNIGTAHVGMLGSRRALAEEKRSILSYADNNTVLVLPDGGEWNDFLLEDFPGQVIWFSDSRPSAGILSAGTKSAGAPPTEAPLVGGATSFGLPAHVFFDSWEDKGPNGQVLMLEGKEIPFALPGRHNRLNAAAALAAARALGLPDKAVFEGLSKVKPAFGRSEIIGGPVSVLRDCYNANPESLAAALDVFESLTHHNAAGTRRIIVLGEMLELGDETEDAVRKAGGAVAALNPDALFLFGPSLEPALEVARLAGYSGHLKLFVEFADLESALASYLRAGDWLLLKGSRASALERLDETIRRVAAA